MNTTLENHARITLPQALGMTADKEYCPGEGIAPVGQTAIARARDILDLMGYTAPDASGMADWAHRRMIGNAFGRIVNPHDRKAEVCMIEFVAECLRYVDDDVYDDLGEKDEEYTWAGGSMRGWRRSHEAVHRAQGITTWAVIRDGSVAGRATTIYPDGPADAVRAIDRDLAAAGVPPHDEYTAIAMPAGWYYGGFRRKRKNEIKLVSEVREKGLAPVPIIVERNEESDNDRLKGD